MTRELATKIATDLVEGGINTRHVTALTAETHNVTISQVRKIKQIVKRMGKSMEVSMIDAIENGWEDDAIKSI